MKNIGLFIRQMNSGGAERVVSRLSKILENDYNVYVILFEDTFMEYECGGTLINLNTPAKSGLLNKLLLLPKRVKALKKVKKEYKLDCVISFLDSPNIVNILSGGSSKNIVSIRNYSKSENSASFIGKLTNILIKKLYKKADFIIPVSKVIANSYIEDYGIPEKKLKTIYNPYNADEIKVQMEEPVNEKVAEFIKDKTVFISVGRIMQQKGYWHLIKAFADVRKTNAAVRLIVVGEDYSNGNAERFVKQLGIENDVLFTGRVKNPFKYLAHSDIYVLSSLFEGFPNGMTEAMVCGLPVIATDCKSGPREILNENPDLKAECTLPSECDYGILVPALEDEEDWEATALTSGEKMLAKAMTELALDNEKRAELSEKALKRGRDFSYEACKEVYISIIENN